MRGRATDPAKKAQVIAALLLGQSVTEVAKQYGLDTGLVSRIKATMPTEVLQEVAAKKEFDFGTQIAHYLQENLKTLAVQAEHFRDLSWLAKQDAADLAVLHGVTTDKAIRLLEAAERAAVRAAESE